MKQSWPILVFGIAIQCVSTISAFASDTQPFDCTIQQQSISIPEQDYTALCSNADIEWVYIPPKIKKILLKNICAIDLSHDKMLRNWFIEQELSVVPRVSIEQTIERLCAFETLSLKKSARINEYKKNLTNGDATITPMNDQLPVRSHRNRAFCNLLVRRALRAQALHVCNGATIEGDLNVRGTIFGVVQPLVIPDERFGNVVRVDQVYGNDETGARNSNPFLTITAALAAAQSGDACWIFPGTYDESFTIPDGVAVIGLTTGGVTISKTVAVDTDLITMGENSRLENVNLSLTSASHVTLRGIVFPGTTTATAKIRTLVVQVDNSTADIGGSSNVYGIHSTGTGTPGDEVSACRASTIKVTSTGLGSKRGLLVDSASHYHVRDSNFLATNGGGGGSYIGAETNNAAAAITLRTSTSSGSTADISQTLGIFDVITTDLLNANANGLSFFTKITPSTLIFADPGALPVGTSYLRPGSGVASSSEIFVRIAQPLVVKTLNVRARVAASTNPTVFTVRRNSIDTLLAATLPAGATEVVNSINSVSFTTGDTISLQVVRTGGGTAANDVVVGIELY